MSTIEKVIVAIILMFAVAIFSIIMGNFIEILMARNNLENSGNHKDLSKWIALLTKFNDQKPLARDLIVKIEDFFEYYWDNNPLMASKSDEDLRFINELPNSTKQAIYIEYLFRDFLYKFNDFFTVVKNGSILQKTDIKWRQFIVRFLDCLEPRRYQATDDEFIQDQFQEVFEVVFVCRGRIIVGYRLFKEVFYAKIVSKSASIGDFSCLNNKVSEFLYKASETVTGFAIKKEKFSMIMR